MRRKTTIKKSQLVNTYQTLLENRLKEMRIAWVRKNGGLQLAVFGKPFIRVFDDFIDIGVVSGIFSGQKSYQTLRVSHGDLVDPHQDPEMSVNKVLQMIQNISDLMDLADDAQEMRYIDAPSSTIRAAVKRELAKHGLHHKYIQIDDSDVMIFEPNHSRAFSTAVHYFHYVKYNRDFELVVWDHEQDKYIPLTQAIENYAASLKD